MKYTLLLALIVFACPACRKPSNPHSYYVDEPLDYKIISLLAGPRNRYDHTPNTLISGEDPRVVLMRALKSDELLLRILTDDILSEHINQSDIRSELKLPETAPDRELVKRLTELRRIEWIDAEHRYFKIEFIELSDKSEGLLRELLLVALDKKWDIEQYYSNLMKDYRELMDAYTTLLKKESNKSIEGQPIQPPRD